VHLDNKKCLRFRINPRHSKLSLFRINIGELAKISFVPICLADIPALAGFRQSGYIILLI
jgi:hypothetical protein